MHDEHRECTSGWSNCIERIDWKGSQKLQGKRWFSPPPTCRDLAPSASNEAENAMHMTHYHSPIPKSPTCKRHRGQNTPKTEKWRVLAMLWPRHGFLFRPLGHGSARGYHMHRSMSNGWLPQAWIGPGKPKPSARMSRFWDEKLPWKSPKSQMFLLSHLMELGEADLLSYF